MVVSCAKLAVVFSAVLIAAPAFASHAHHGGAARAASSAHARTSGSHEKASSEKATSHERASSSKDRVSDANKKASEANDRASAANDRVSKRGRSASRDQESAGDRDSASSERTSDRASSRRDSSRDRVSARGRRGRSRSQEKLDVSVVTKTHRLHGQQSIAPERVTEIQQALIREGYLSTEANGVWDSTTQAAMQKYQMDQGWQTKLMPDSRALKKLGLGPDYSNAINANGAKFDAPKSTGTTSATQAADFATAAGVSR